MIIRREIVIAIVEDVEHESLGIEVNVPEGMTTLEAIGLMEIAKAQHLQSKHAQGPSVYLAPDEGRTAPAPPCSTGHLWVGRDGRPATGDAHDRCDACGTRRGHCTCPLNARTCPWHGAASRG